MLKTISSFFISLLVIVILLLGFTSPILGQGYDTADGHGSGDGGDTGGQQSFSDTNGKAADGYSDYSDSGNSNSSNEGNSSNTDVGSYSDNSNDGNGSFSEYVSESFGLGNEAGVESNPGGPAPLSNQNHTTDNGATASFESIDEGYECTRANCDAPVLTGTTTCQGSLPIVDLSWTGNQTNIRYWHVLKGVEPNPQFTQSNFYWFTERSSREKNLLPNTIYYFGVFGSNSGNGAGYSARTPLSDIFAVYTPSCAPVVTAVCPTPGAPEKFNLTWNNNDPAASGYKLYRGANENTATRVFLPPNHSASTSSFTDGTVVAGTSYNYWLRSYVTVYHAAYSEVTSTDENGNPTGYIDYPAYYEDVEAPFSGMSISKTPQMCLAQAVPSPSVAAPVVPIPPVNPTINLYLNDQPSSDLLLVVDLDTPVTIRWTVTNATGCTASADPVQTIWVGSQNPSNGTQLLDTSSAGTYQFSLECVNENLTTTVTSQLKVRAVNDPYIKTTGGDVHSNKNITVPNQ